MPYNVLVVDDSVIYRKALSRILSAIEGIDEIRQASNGKEGVKLYAEKQADLVTMDVEMPIMNGIEALTEILKINPNAKVLMISSVTTRGASYTLDALNIGAFDFITKEQAFGLRNDQAEKLSGELQTKIKIALGASGAKVIAPVSKIAPVLKSIPPKIMIQKETAPFPVRLLLIGISTGGPPALIKLLTSMESRRNYPTVIVQHMPPLFTKQLAKNLSSVCKKNVTEASDGMILEKDHIVIAPGGQHLVLEKDVKNWVCRITDTEPVNSCKPSVDVTFESVAKQMRSKEAVAMIMTGIGADGAKGCEALAKKGVPILTQDKASCVVYGMPKAVDDRGLSSVHASPSFLIHEAEKFMMHAEQL